MNGENKEKNHKTNSLRKIKNNLAIVSELKKKKKKYNKKFIYVLNVEFKYMTKTRK